jgi:hypothetical protein
MLEKDGIIRTCPLTLEYLNSYDLPPDSKKLA